MSNVIDYKFTADALGTFASARDQALKLGYPFIPLDIYLYTLYGDPQSPVYQYGVRCLSKESYDIIKQEVLRSHLIAPKIEYQYEDYTIGAATYTFDIEIIPLLNHAYSIAVSNVGPGEEPYITFSYLIEAFSSYFEAYFGSIISTIESRALKAAEKTSESGEFAVPEALSGFLEDMGEIVNGTTMADCEICGRDEEIWEIVKILLKMRKSNVILIGDPGVGKTAVMEKLTWMIKTETCPVDFIGYHVLILNVTSLISGTKYRGEAEDRFKLLVNYLKATEKIILFIDEIHMIMGAGQVEGGSIDLSNSLKAVLARDNVRVVGATTTDEYNKYLSRDGALDRRFETLEIKEPKSYEVPAMIANQVKKLEGHHKVTISDELVKSVVFYAAVYNYRIKNPDRTLDLLEKCMVNAHLAGKTEVEFVDIQNSFNANKKLFAKMSDADKKSIAYHEVGHFLVTKYSPKLIDQIVLAISIIPANDFLGVNVLEPVEEAMLLKDRAYFIQEIGASLGGRIAEQLYTKTLSSGASTDLEHANTLAKAMVTKYSLDPDLKNRTFDISQNGMMTPHLGDLLNDKVSAIIEEATKYATEIIEAHKEELVTLVNALLDKGILSMEEIDKLISR